MNLAHFPYEEDWLEMERRRIPCTCPYPAGRSLPSR